MSCQISVYIGAYEFSATVDAPDGFFAETEKLGPLIDQVRHFLEVHPELDVGNLDLDMRQPRLSIPERLRALKACRSLVREVEKHGT